VNVAIVVYLILRLKNERKEERSSGAQGSSGGIRFHSVVRGQRAK
jgi:hypothetical protein